MKEEQLIPHLFRVEFSKIVAILCKKFGLSNIQLVEDFVSDTFLIATETWGLKGIPDNPTSWLYSVAGNKIKDYFKRREIFKEKITPILKSESDYSVFETDLSDKNILDSQLQMIFAVCHPSISVESQIALALRVLCGLGIDEISKAFLSNKETINKRLHRAKEKLRKHKVNLSFPSSENLKERLDSVLSIIYLLFNEGYYSMTFEQTLRKDLCIEAMRLTYMLLEYESTNLPKTNALMGLLCFHSSRFEARTNTSGALILYAEQDEKKWDFELIRKGEYYLNQSAKGDVTKYHLEAGISFWHTKKSNEKEKWDAILQLYNQLLQIEYSPVAALNRTYALSKVKGKQFAIIQALKINLKENHLYHSLVADLYNGIDCEKERDHLNIALALVKNTNEKKIIIEKMNRISND